MYSDQRRRTRRVDHHGWTAQGEKVGQPISDAAARAAGASPYIDLFEVPRRHVSVLADACACENTRLRAANGLRRNSRVLQRFTRHLQQQALLRIHRGRLTRRDVEELRVE